MTCASLYSVVIAGRHRGQDVRTHIDKITERMASLDSSSDMMAIATQPRYAGASFEQTE